MDGIWDWNIELDFVFSRTRMDKSAFLTNDGRGGPGPNWSCLVDPSRLTGRGDYQVSYKHILDKLNGIWDWNTELDFVFYRTRMTNWIFIPLGDM